MAGFRSKIEDDVARRRSKKAKQNMVTFIHYHVVCKYMKHVTEQNQPILTFMLPRIVIDFFLITNQTH